MEREDKKESKEGVRFDEKKRINKGERENVKRRKGVKKGREH